MGVNRSLEDFSDVELGDIGIRPGAKVKLAFDAGITVTGKVVDMTRANGKIVLIAFQDCTVTDTHTGKVYFKPEWGNYDMAVGDRISSVFCGAADKDAYEQVSLVSNAYTLPIDHPHHTRQLHQLY